MLSRVQFRRDVFLQSISSMQRWNDLDPIEPEFFWVDDRRKLAGLRIPVEVSLFFRRVGFTSWN